MILRYVVDYTRPAATVRSTRAKAPNSRPLPARQAHAATGDPPPLLSGLTTGAAGAVQEPQGHRRVERVGGWSSIFPVDREEHRVDVTDIGPRIEIYRR